MRVQGRTRWRRFTLAFFPGIAVVATLLVLMATGAIALPIVISGVPFTVEASSLEASGFVQYGAVDVTPESSPVMVAVTELQNAKISDLVQTICVDLPAPLPAGRIVIAADTATATSMVVDATALTGDASFNDLEMGIPVTRRDVTSIGQTASSVVISGLNQTAVYTSAATFVLDNLDLSAALVGSCG